MVVNVQKEVYCERSRREGGCRYSLVQIAKDVSRRQWHGETREDRI